ncbi:sulfite exporter TauE/SafE family protein, partial [Porticoccaceae bacterium]|nr:sulfite exporter TauE/SafE family protein [Porticoccaceae bacterium]
LSLQGSLLQLLFGFFLFLAALQMLFYKPIDRDHSSPSGSLLGLAGIFIGSLSTLFGIGGGTLTTPLLTFLGIRIHQAVASAAACGFPIAVAASLVYSTAQMPAANLPANSLGYIFIPAWLGIVVVSAPCARFGALLAHRANGILLKKLFGIVLLLLGGRFIWVNLTH